jgi:mRNA interferase YafQ
MYELLITTKFKKDLKKYKGEFSIIKEVLDILKEKGVSGIPQKMKPHPLKGNYKDCLECHIKPDLLIIWIQVENPKEITLVRIGSHAELF